MNEEKTNDFKSIVLNETPLIDVRAPIEFEKGAFYNAVNLPILDNDERHEVGKKYKESGHEGATALGYALISGENKAKKLHAWRTFIDQNPNALIYCARGGQRSEIAREWIQKETGKSLKRLEGGYKAFRTYLISELNADPYPFAALRLGGYTGSGKTRLLNQIENAIDLEALANHRGSSFGSRVTPQPSQINFENHLAYRLIQKTDKGFQFFIFEDESRNIGKRCIPQRLYQYIHEQNIVLLDVPFKTRVEMIHDEYVVHSQQDCIDYYGPEEGLRLWSENLLNSLGRIKKRLGGELFNALVRLVNQGIAEQDKRGNLDAHKLWIIKLLKAYYDPMYRYQIEESRDKIVFKGDERAVLQYINGLK